MASQPLPAIEPKKRGRKKGQPRKKHEQSIAPADVLDYLARNYPLMQIDQIRENVLANILPAQPPAPYVLDKITHMDKTYYCDSNGSVLDRDAKLVGIMVARPIAPEPTEPIEPSDPSELIGFELAEPNGSEPSEPKRFDGSMEKKIYMFASIIDP
jgi:hypothetical protein